MNAVTEYEGNEFQVHWDLLIKGNIQKVLGGNTHTNMDMENRRESWILEAGQTKNVAGASSNMEGEKDTQQKEIEDYDFHAIAKNLKEAKNVSKVDNEFRNKSRIDSKEKARNSSEIDDKEKEKPMDIKQKKEKNVTRKNTFQHCLKEIVQSQFEKVTEKDMIYKVEIGDTDKNGVKNIESNEKEYMKMDEKKEDVPCCSNETVFGENSIRNTKSNWKQVIL